MKPLIINEKTCAVPIGSGVWLADAVKLQNGVTQKGRRGHDPAWRHIYEDKKNFRIRIRYAGKIHSRQADSFEDAQEVRDQLKKDLGCARIEQPGLKARAKSNTEHRYISKSFPKNSVGTPYLRFDARVYTLGGVMKRKAFWGTPRLGGEQGGLLAAVTWQRNEVAADIQETFGLPKSPLALVPVSKGGFAMVDAADLPNVEKYHWTWMHEKGVAAFEGNQTILLHNLIAPYAAVSFVNGDKRDCRRANLMQMVRGSSGTGKKSVKGNITLDKKNLRWTVHRKVIVNGETYAWATAIRFGTKRTSGEAKTIARSIVTGLFEMSREQFAEFVKFNRGKKTTNQIVSEWDAFGGEEMTAGAVSQIGMYHNPEEQ